jgi:hypothetical protein
MEGQRLTLKEVNAMLGPGLRLARWRDANYVGPCYLEKYGWKVEGAAPVVMSFYTCDTTESPDGRLLRDSRIVYPK